MSLKRSLSRMASNLSLWGSWTSDPVADYDKTLHKYPWLSRDVEEAPDHKPLTAPMPRPMFADTGSQPWYPLAQRHYYGEISVNDLERDSLQETPEGSTVYPEEALSSRNSTEEGLAQDPNLVSPLNYLV